MLKSFDIMKKDKCICEVHIDKHDVSIVYHTNVPHERPFYKEKTTIWDVLDWIESRCFPRTRANAKEVLAQLGLKTYDPLDIVHVTHGLLYEDYIWIKWEGENIDYESIKIRD